MHPPEQIDVHIDLLDSGSTSVAALLVALELRHQGRNYYSTLVGLTNTDGVATLHADRLRQMYQSDQQAFPMDYKLQLEACEDWAVATIVGGSAFENQRGAALASGLLRPEYRSWYEAARNQFVTSDSTLFALAGPVARAVLVVEAQSLGSRTA